MRSAFAGVVLSMGWAMTANAQAPCPTGDDLKQQAIAADEAYAATPLEVKTGQRSDSASKRARALAYLTYESVTYDREFEKVHAFKSPAFKCHPDDCPAGIGLTEEERSEFKAVARSEVDAYVDGSPKLPWAPVLKKIPTEPRIAWAEEVLNCYISPEMSGSPSYAGTVIGAGSGYSSASNAAPPPQPTGRVEQVYGDWARGSGHYCRNNEFQTDNYAMANARKACRDAGGTDGFTRIVNSGYDWYRSNSEQCYQAKAVTECTFD